MEVLTNALTLLRKFVAGLAEEVKAAEQDTVEFGKMDLRVKDIDQCHELNTSLLCAWQMQFGDELRKAIVQGNKPRIKSLWDVICKITSSCLKEDEALCNMVEIAYELGKEASDSLVKDLRENVLDIRLEKQKAIRERNRLSLELRAKEKQARLDWAHSKAKEED